MKCVGLVVGLLVVGSLFGKEASFGDFDARAKAGIPMTSVTGILPMRAFAASSGLLRRGRFAACPKSRSSAR